MYQLLRPTKLPFPTSRPVLSRPRKCMDALANTDSPPPFLVESSTSRWALLWCWAEYRSSSTSACTYLHSSLLPPSLRLTNPCPPSQSIIIGAYVLIFGLAVALLEFQIPPQVSRYASFMFSFIGRGIFYVFVGSILLNNGVLRIIAGSIVGIVGLGYIALEFVPSIEPPANMREADAGWGAEQV